jgi:thiol-disulfide isomerase/thioredoxin
MNFFPHYARQLLLGLALALGLISNALLAASGQLKPYKGDLTSPEINLQDLRGQAHNLEDYEGNIVLVQFWATYCTPCRKQMPSMNQLIKKMEGKPFKIITVNMAEPKPEGEKFIEQIQVDFPVLLDTDDATMGQWKVFPAPSNFFLNKQGKIIFTLFGAIDWDSADMVKKLSVLTTL